MKMNKKQKENAKVRLKWLTDHCARKTKLPAADVEKVIKSVTDLYENPKHEYDWHGIDLEDICEMLLIEEPTEARSGE